MTSRAAVVAIGLCVVVFSTLLGKDIWTDEVLHFALGSLDSTLEAWKTICRSQDINHGQTGIYMILDYWLLKLFGASRFWLRFPSFLSGFLLVFAAVHFFRGYKISPRWQIWGLLALYAQKWLMTFVGEARPYLPLAATAVAALAYYSRASDERGDRATRFLGYSGVLIGSIMHPYFAVCWGFSALLGYLLVAKRKNERPSVVSLWRHLNVPLCLLGSALYFGVGQFTWLSHKFGGGLDPFEYVGHGAQFFRVFVNAHFGFMGRLGMVGFLLLALFLGFFLSRQKGPRFIIGQICAGPGALMAGAFFLSLFVSWASWRSGYWILQRQWIVSFALVPIAATWLLANVESRLPLKFRSIFFGLTLVVILFQGAPWLLENVSSAKLQFTRKPRSYSEGAAPRTTDEFVVIANANCDQGGPVWPIFKKFY